MKRYNFGAQAASDECPEVPHGGAVVCADTPKEATEILAKALEKDPTLEKEHPEFEKKAVKVQTSKRKSSIS